MTFQLFNRELKFNRDGRMWMSTSGGQLETQIGDANVGRVWVKDRFGLGAVGVNGYVLNCAGQASFTSAVQFMGTNSAISLNNGSYLNFSNNGSIRRYTPDAIEGLYIVFGGMYFYRSMYRSLPRPMRRLAQAFRPGD